ncbi:MAG TPA: CocE/NonD family hydrolase [Pseudonocardiaceae bacterium]
MGGFLAWGFDRLLGLPPAAAPDVRRHQDLRIPLSDGVITLADWYRPNSDAQPMPVVLVRTPYGHRTLLGRLLGSVLARRGLQVVVQSVRGTFGSGGEYWPMHQERDDGLATVAWLREQPWCDGRIATAGPSYLGLTQWSVGPYLDEPLEAMCVSVTTSDFPRTFYPDGSLSLYSLLNWSAMIGTQEDGTPLSRLFGRRRREERIDKALRSLPLRDADRVAIDKPVRFWQEVIEHTEPGDDFWKPINHRPLVAKLTTPTTMVTGWYDLFLPAQLDDFRDLQRAGRNTRITIGPWAHADPGNIKIMLADTANFLVAHLGGNTSELNRAPVRLYLQHADRWLDFPTWPPEEATPTAIHLHPGRRLDWTSPTESEPDAFDYDPADPTPSTGGPLLNGKTKQRDNTAIEARDDVLTYTGDRLTRDLDLAGELEATVHLRIELGHGDLFVRLCDVDLRGVSRNVCDGMIRLRAGDLEPAQDGSVEVRLTMYPTGYRFRRGHRLRVQIAAGAFPRFARNHGTEESMADAVATTRNHYEILHDAEHPSRMILPVLSS